MGNVDSHQGQAELRQRPRRPLHYRARILLSKKGQPRSCSIEDISESGVRIVLQADEELPKRFLLFLSARGGARICREVWRDELAVVVEFLDGDRS